MSGETDRRGTMWDWPVAVMIAGLLLVLVPSLRGLGVVLLIAGGVSLMIRRGAFTPRR